MPSPDQGLHDKQSIISIPNVYYGYPSEDDVLVSWQSIGDDLILESVGHALIFRNSQTGH